jgi:predicted ATPase
LFWLGELTSAREHLEQGTALYDPLQHSSHALLYGEDPGVFCLSFAAWTLWLLGYPDQALQRSHEALTLAQEASHPLSLTYALHLAARLHQFRREGQTTQERAEAAITLSIEQGFPVWVAWGNVLRGWALAEQGQREEGIAQIRQGLTTWRVMEMELLQPYYLALLAEAYRKAGKAEEGLTVLAEALAVVTRTRERFYEAELSRLKGELTLLQCHVPGSKFQVSAKQKVKGRGQKSKILDAQHSAPDTHLEAEACFQKAIEVARRQSAKSLELRAVMSLAKLWQQQGKQKEAHDLLAEIYGWFTEGFDTKDLQEAKELLEQLS